MDLKKAIKTRRSIRQFKKRKVDLKLVKKLVELSCWAPSACNRQLWKFVLIDKEGIKKELFQAGAQKWVLDAPLVIAVFYHKFINSEHNANIQSAAAAVQNFMLLAHNEGLGCLWMAGVGEEEKIKKLLKAPEEFKLITFICVGYPDQAPTAPKRRNLEEILDVNIFPGTAFPNSISPKDWNIDLLRDFQEKTCRASNLGVKQIYYEDIAKEIVKNEVASLFEGKSLDLLSYDGTLLALLAQRRRLFSLEMSDEVINFIKAHLAKKGLSDKVEFIKSPTLNLQKAGCFDTVSILFKLEMLNPLDRKALVDEAFRLLKPGGKLVLLYRNRFSVRWLKKFWDLTVKGKNTLDKHYMSMWNAGPYIALSNGQVKSLLKKFSSASRKNFGFLPHRRSLLDFLAPFCEYQLIVAEK